MNEQPGTFERPQWLVEPCPVWCDGDHTGQEHPVDQKHFNDHMVVAVVAPDDLDEFVPGRPSPSYPDELVVSVFRRVGYWETWVTLSTGRRSLVVSIESARRLYDSLGLVLDAVAVESLPTDSIAQ